MFVRVKKIGGYEYLYLVENAREGGRHVQRVIKALGRRNEVDAAGALDSLIAFLSEVEVEQDGRRAKLGTAPGPTIDPICRALGIARTPVFEELPPPQARRRP